MVYSTKQKGKIPFLMVEYLAGWKSILQVKRAMWEKCKAREKELGPEGIKALFEGGVRGAGIREVEIHPRVYIVQRLPTPTQVAVLGPARVTRREINYNEEDEEDVPFDDEEYEPPHPPPRAMPYTRSVLDEEWDVEYRRSPLFTNIYRRVKGETEGLWPSDIKIYKNKLYHQELLCVPKEKLPRVVQEQHVASGHVGVDRLMEECGRRYFMEGLENLKKYCVDAKKYCITCQQCDPPTYAKSGPITKFPIRPKIWDSICMDMFSMPMERFEGNNYNSIFVCVDRHTGWIIAIPTTKNLTAEGAAKLILQKWLDMGGGIPSIITSDQGSHFIGGWFRTLCSQLGVRQAYSQAYRAQANGRAERAGRQIIDIINKLCVDSPLNWVECLPRVLVAFHDSNGESGISPIFLCLEDIEI